MANGGDVAVTMKASAKVAVMGAIANAVAQIFEADIKGEAQELSPLDTGKNKRSIETDTTELGTGGVLAVIFTQSGYGGYLELGHRVRGDSGNMVQGTPYIYPAVINNMPALRALCTKNIETVRLTV